MVVVNVAPMRSCDAKASRATAGAPDQCIAEWNRMGRFAVAPPVGDGGRGPGPGRGGGGHRERHMPAPSRAARPPHEPIPGPAKIPVALVVNGTRKQLKIAPGTTLLDALRDHLDLTGTKKGCDHGQ